MASKIAAVLLGIATACGATACRAPGAARPEFPDAPYQLRDDGDRAQATDQLWVLPAGLTRDRVRADVAAAIARRLDDALVDDQPVAVQALVFELAGLWQEDPADAARGLAPHVDLLRRARTTLARTGAVEPVIAVLTMLAEADPPTRDARIAEIGEILEFSGANNAPSLLQPTVYALPLGWLTERYVALLVQRQRIVDQAFAHGGPRDVPAAARDVLVSARRIAFALARASRTDDIAGVTGAISGVGEDGALVAHARAITGGRATPAAYMALAGDLAHVPPGSDGDGRPHPTDPMAALVVCEAGLRRFPRAPGLLATAAEVAAEVGRVEQPIALYKEALAAGADDATALRLGRLVSERIARLAFGGRPAAARTAWRELEGYADHAHAHSPDVWSRVESTAETALGRGLLSQGDIAEAERVLVASVDRAPSIDAYEALTAMYFKTDRLASASHTASAGLALLGESSSDAYRRAKLERLAADVMRTAGRSRDAAALYLDSLKIWTQLGDDRALPRTIAAERKLDVARGMWYLGNSDRAVDLALEATDTAPDAGTTTVDTVAFLLEVGKPAEALDAIHRGLGAPELGELDKVYICLWSLVDARRRGVDRDRQAWGYLASRHGELWYERLAAAASGRLGWTELAAQATTEPRQAELAFYGAALGLDPAARDPAAARKALERAVGAHLVMDAEYDFARQYLMAP